MADLFLKESSFKASRLDAAVWATKLVLFSAGIVATGLLFKVAIVPFTFNFVISTLPSLWSSFRSWLSPLYIYIIVHIIIITIAAYSNFNAPLKNRSTPETKPIKEEAEKQAQQKKPSSGLPQNDEEVFSSSTPSDTHLPQAWEDEEIQENHADPLVEIADSDRKRRDVEPLGLGGAEEELAEDDDSLDATWKAIMEAQGKPPAPQLKKSDTWDVPPRLARAKPQLEEEEEEEEDPVAWARRELTKSDTFSDSVSLRREKSLSQDELNQRAEALIKKVKDEMRLQRLESEMRSRKLVKRGV